MIQTEQVVERFATEVLNLLKADGEPFLTEIRHLGRKLKDGQIRILGTEKYAGPDGGAAPYGYIRYRDGSKDHVFERPVKKHTSEPEIQVRALLRMVIVHKCTNEAALQSAVIAAILASAMRVVGDAGINLLGGSGDGKTVLPEETNKEAEYLGEANLFAVDFDLTYQMSSGSNDCTFRCDGCC